MAYSPKLNKHYIGFFLISLILGCASPRPNQVSTPSDHIPEVSQRGAYHTVKRGETLWRIANIYAVPMESLIRANKLSNPNMIIEGHKLWIPMVEKVTHKPGSPKGNRKTGLDFIWPVKGEIVNYFTRSDREIRPGIDISAPLGGDILSALSGKVIFSGEGPGTLGKMVIIDHSDGLTTIYANNLENLVSVDQQVRKGERIARVGISPRSSIPSLHFEIRKDAVAYNPLFYLPSRY